MKNDLISQSSEYDCGPTCMTNAIRFLYEREESQPERQFQPGPRALHYDDPGSAAAEEGLIRLLYLDPALGRSAELPDPAEFSAPVLGRIYAALREKIDSGQDVSTASMSAVLSQEEMSLLVRVLQKPELLSRSEQTMQDYIETIRKRKELAASSDDLRAYASRLRERKGYEG